MRPMQTNAALWRVNVSTGSTTLGRRGYSFDFRRKVAQHHRVDISPRQFIAACHAATKYMPDAVWYVKYTYGSGKQTA